MVRGTRERLKALFILLGRKGWGWIVLALGTTLIQALMESLIIGALILLAYSLGILNKTQLPIWLPFRLINCKIDIILAILILLGALRAGAQSISSCTKHMILEWIRARIQRIQGFRLLMLPDLPPIAISDVHLMMSDHLNKATSWCFSGLQMITSIIIATSFFIALYFIAWRQALLALVCLPLFGLLVKYLKCYILSHAVNIPRHRSSLEQTIVRISRNRVLIKVLHLREKELKHYNDAVSAYFDSSCKTFYSRDIAVAMMPLIGIVIIVIIVWFDSTYIHSLPATLMGSVYLFLALTRQMTSIVDNAGALVQTQIAFNQAADLVLSVNKIDRLRAFCEPQSDLNLSDKQPLSYRSPPEIILERVDFCWPGAQVPIFNRFNLHIPSGSRFGIVGPNGSGKTTLLHLILGLEKPQAGTVLVGGIPARDYAEVRGLISYVGTENLLISGSVRDNLLYGINDRIDDSDLLSVLNQVGLGSWISSLTKGLDYPIGENEEGISSGQKQRLSLARALLRRPSLLVLDEASANIDSRSELEVVSLLDTIAPTCTIIIVSHKSGILSGISHRLELSERNND